VPLARSVIERLDKLFRPHHLPIERAGNQRVLLDGGFGIACDGHAVYFQRAAQRALVVGLGFGEIREGAQFIALSGDQVALRQNDVVNGRRAELIFFLLGVERLLLQLEPGRGPVPPRW
jgi:hypothetical protein